MPELTAPTIEKNEKLSLDVSNAPVPLETEDPILSWLKPLFTLWLIFASLHISQLAHLSLSVDNEFAAVPKDYLFLIEQGRWGAFLIDALALPLPLAAVPFFPIAVYGFFGAAAYLVAVFALTGKKPGALSYLLFPLFIAHPVLQFQQFFCVNVTPQGVALLLAWTGALLYSKIGAFGVRSCLLTLGAILCGCLSISSYQSNATLVLNCLLIAACSRLVPLKLSPEGNDSSSASPVRVLGLIALIMAGSLLLYKLASELMIMAWSIEKSSYLDQFFHPELLLSQPATVFRNFLMELYAIYGVAATRYGVPGAAVGVLILASICLVALYVGKSRQKSKLFLATLLVLILLAPFALSILNCGALPLRTYAAAPMSYWFLAFLAMQVSSRLVQRVGYIFILSAILTSSYMLSYYAAGAQIARAHDQRTAHVVVHEIEKLIPDFRSNAWQYKLISFGQITSDHAYTCRTDCTPATPLFEYEGGNPHRVVALIRALGLATVNYPEVPDMESALPRFKDMPIWPQTGSIRVVGKTVLIKLSEPGPATDNVMRALGVKL